MWRGSGAGERRPVRDVPQNDAANHVRFFLIISLIFIITCIFSLMRNFGKIIKNKNLRDTFKVNVINSTPPFKYVNKTICYKSTTNKEKCDVFFLSSLFCLLWWKKRPKPKR